MSCTLFFATGKMKDLFDDVLNSKTLAFHTFASCTLAHKCLSLLASYQNMMSFGIDKYSEAVQNLELFG